MAKSAFDAIVLEGGLIQPDMVAAIAAAQAGEQGEADYGLDPKEKLRDVVQTKFTLAQSLYVRFLGSDKGPAAARRLATGLIVQVFEFADLAETAAVQIADRIFPIGYQALGGRVPVVLAPYGMLEQPLAIFGDGTRRRSAAQLLQEYLNASDNALWGIACDGVRLRLCRDSASLTRPAYIEADLARIFDADAPLIADFAALWLLIHASRFGKAGAPVSDSPLERWREEGRKQGATARERLRDGVQEALLAIARGFLQHPANEALRAELSGGKLSPQDYLEALLRLIYRFIFVFTAEDRDVLHLPPPEDQDAYEAWRASKSLYARGYSFARLRERAAKRSSRDRHGDGWEGVQIVFRALARGEKRLALPALGGLFGVNGAREFGDCALTNAWLYEALFHLTWLSTDAGLERVNWRDMQTEELGSVYESLLELSPRIGGPEAFDFVEVAGNERKTTASYYTPDSLVQALLDETLDPLIAETVKGKPADNAAEALLSLRIIDPACGSGHFLLAAARRIAARVAELKSPGATTTSDFRHWLRECARRCLFGVDRNPMAVDLAKVALWIETVEPGKPLTFLNAHIRCGDALLGIYDLSALEKGVPDDAYKALTGDDKSAAREWAKRNRAEREARDKGQLPISEPPRAFREAVLAIEAGAEDALSDVEAKNRAFRDLLAGPVHYTFQVACDLYIAAFLLPKKAPPGRHAGEARCFLPTSKDVWERLSGHQISGQVEANGIDATRQARVFHWPLEYPQVFFPATGERKGFDLAIGNPPWDRIKLQEKEFFASRAPDIAEASNKAARQQMIDALASAPAGSADARLFESFTLAKRLSEAASTFARTPPSDGGRFPFTGQGDVNTYALFAELMSSMGRRTAAILPRGIVTDATTSRLFADLVSRDRVESCLSFENEALIFPAVHHGFQFVLLVLGQNRSGEIRFSNFIRYIEELRDTRRRCVLNKEEISLLNPNTKTAPIVRSQSDVDLVLGIYGRASVLIRHGQDSTGNHWRLEFSRMFDMASDSALFRTATELRAAGAVQDENAWKASEAAIAHDVMPGRWVPLYEAKMISFYDHRFGSYEQRGEDRGFRVLPETALNNYCDRSFEPSPFYFVPEEEVSTRLPELWHAEWLLAFKDVTAATNERTAIFSFIPRCGVGHSAPLIFSSRAAPLVASLVACLNSLVMDYSARTKVGGLHLTYAYLEQFPVPSPQTMTESVIDFLVSRVLELTYTSHSMRPFANDLGYEGPPFVWNEDRRALLRAELDSKIAKLYGLDRNQLRYILDPEDVMGKGYPSETFRVLKKNEIAIYGDYRTARLVLDAWDRLERGELT